ncbi:MAG: Ribosomal silencing factor RsfS [Candidatus Omnitrophica bacterium]|nr:Ribosomal silencing factor RsfS [Candidatus Omnitrophota bacterium]
MNEKTRTVCEAGWERKAEDITIMDMKDRSALCDTFVVMSGSSTVRVKAIVDRIEEAIEEAGGRVYHKEGYQEAQWVLMDLGDVVVHVFHEQMRRFYALERLWGDAPRKQYLK